MALERHGNPLIKLIITGEGNTERSTMSGLMRKVDDKGDI